MQSFFQTETDRGDHEHGQCFSAALSGSSSIRQLRSLGIEAHLLDVRRPADLQGGLDAAAKWRAEALVVGLDGVAQANLRPIAEIAAKQRLPSIYPAKDYAMLGGLMAYGSR